MKPEDLEALANRIDSEELWRRNPFDRDQLTQEQRDRLDAGVNLRRYAHGLGLADRVRAEGAMFITGYKLADYSGGTYGRGCGTHEWHVAINRFSDAQRQAGKPWPRMMYAAKTISHEVRRMILLFERERTTGLDTSYRMCGHDPRPATPLPDNHLRCHLGQECRKCEFLGAIDANPGMTPEAKDEAKAWTCATHILLESDEDGLFLEQCLYDKSDDAFNARLIESFAQEHGGPEDDDVR